MTYAALPILSGDRGLARYLNEIRQFPLLEPQQEYTLAKRWREHDDREAARQLITSHLRLVAKLAMRNRRYGLPMSEIISEGNVGLMQALKRFEPERGFRFATYAMWWIKASIQEYIMRSWSLVKISATANQRKLFFNLRRAKSRISSLDGGDSAIRPSQANCEAARRQRAGRDRHGSSTVGRRFSQCPVARGRWRMARFTRRRRGRSGTQARQVRGSLEAPRRSGRLSRCPQSTRTAHLRGTPPDRRSNDPSRSLLRTRREPGARTPDRVPRLRKDSTRGEDGLRGAGSNPDFSGSRIERIGSRAAPRRCRCTRWRCRRCSAMRGDRGIGLVLSRYFGARRPPRSHCASGAPAAQGRQALSVVMFWMLGFAGMTRRPISTPAPPPKSHRRGVGVVVRVRGAPSQSCTPRATIYATMCAALSNVGRLAVCEITGRFQCRRSSRTIRRKKAPLSGPS